MNWDWEKLQQKNQQQRRQQQGVPPQMDDFLNKFKDLKIPGGPVWIILLIVLAFFIKSMIYQVEANEVGVVQLFGRYVRTVGPGLNFKWPDGIEKVTKVKVDYIYKEEFGFETLSAGRTRFAADSDNLNESLMLTGDLNVAVVPWIVQYRIKDPFNYLFKVHDVKRLLRDMSEASMRLVVGDRSIDEVISKRQDIALEAKELLQKELDNAETGINLVTIEMKKTNVPGPVQPAFNQVNQAVQEKEKLIYEAREDYNKAIPAARGEADRTIKAAEGYALDVVNRAEGDANRFAALYKEYAKAKDVTKRRIYLEMLKELFPKMGNKYIIDSDEKNVLPLLNLGKQETIAK